MWQWQMQGIDQAINSYFWTPNTLLSQASYRMSFVSILKKYIMFFLLFSIIEANCKFKHI